MRQKFGLGAAMRKAGCLLHDHEIRTCVWLPSMRDTPPGVDAESVRSPPKSSSRNNPPALFIACSISSRMLPNTLFSFHLMSGRQVRARQTDMWTRFASKVQTILQSCPNIPHRNDRHPNKEWKLCAIFDCFLIGNSQQRTTHFAHDLACRNSMIPHGA